MGAHGNLKRAPVPSGQQSRHVLPVVAPLGSRAECVLRPGNMTRAVNLRHLLVITAVLLCSLGGCATPPPAADADAVADFKEANDPLEPTNRAIYAFDDALDTVILRPAAKAYRLLALWGLPEGPFLYLPVFGPSDPWDAIGLAGNAVMDPFTWVGQGTTVRALDWSRMGVNAIDQRERHLDDIDSTKKTALDPYATFRSLYRQHRRGQVDDLRKDTRATIPVWFPESGTSDKVTYSPAVSPAY